MRISVKTILFFFLPLLALLFVQAEKGKLRTLQHKISLVDDQSDICASSDNDSISFSAIDDDDDDDSSESIGRLLPGIASSINLVSVASYQSSIPFPPSGKTAYREISPSFLRVFRI